MIKTGVNPTNSATDISILNRVIRKNTRSIIDAILSKAEEAIGNLENQFDFAMILFF